MRIAPMLTEGTAFRDLMELAARIEKLKREVGKAFGYDRGAWMQRRKVTT